MTATTTTVERDREARVEARRAIVRAANRHALARHRRTGLGPFFAAARRGVALRPAIRGPKHVQQCVRTVRHHGLVEDEVLVAAGYHPRGAA